MKLDALPSAAISSVTVIWFMIAAACLTLAGVHGLIWPRQRAAPAAGSIARSPATNH